MRRYLGRWARHMTRQLKQENPSTSSCIDDLEATVEVELRKRLNPNLALTLTADYAED
jgi:hypothetical protein